LLGQLPLQRVHNVLLRNLLTALEQVRALPEPPPSVRMVIDAARRPPDEHERRYNAPSARLRPRLRRAIFTSSSACWWIESLLLRCDGDGDELWTVRAAVPWEVPCPVTRPVIQVAQGATHPLVLF
jgi:hypothetical protein